MKKFITMGLVVFCGFSGYADDTETCHSVSFVTGYEPVRSANGELLPHHSWGGMIERGIFFILEQQGDWFQGDLLPDGEGGFYPPYFSYARCKWNGVPISDSEAVYPASHFSGFIGTFLKIYRYTGNEECLQRACALADWTLAHSTPSTNVYGNLPYSTFVQGEAGGNVDGDSIMTDKPAKLASEYLRLYRATLNTNYLDGAVNVADTLAANIRANGTIPFRVYPETGEIKEDYTSSHIFVVELFEELDEFFGTNRYTSAKDQVWTWIVQNPVSNMVWNGYYGDVGNDPDNRTNADCIWTARYLLRHRSENTQYVGLALNLHDWMYDTFATTNHYYAPSEGFREQLACFDIMGVHMMNWSRLLADLYQATGDEEYKNRIRGMINFLTYMQPSNNRIAVGPWFGRFWYSCHMSPMRYIFELFGEFPEWAPEGETHLLNSAGEVRAVQYAFNSVSYITDRSGQEVLRLAYPLKQIRVNGNVLDESQIVFDSQTGVLRFANPEAGAVFVEMEGQSRLELMLQPAQ